VETTDNAISGGRMRLSIRDRFRLSSGTMHRRLLLFMLALLLLLLTGSAAAFIFAGKYFHSSGETAALLNKELHYLTEYVSKQYGGAASQAVKLSTSLTDDINTYLRDKGLAFSEIRDHPEMLEDMQARLLPRLIQALDNTDCSGAFFALDMTVNPALEDASDSKSGLYIRNLYPNIRGAGSGERLLLRGFSSLAIQGSLNMQAEWDLEFHTAGLCFFDNPRKALLENPDLPISRLIYWCHDGALPELNEEVMLCSIPLLDSSGSFLGVCGFEICQRNFLLRYQPESTIYYNKVSFLAPVSNGGADLSRALFSGNSREIEQLSKGSISLTLPSNTGLQTYTAQEVGSFVGLHETMTLYPDGTPFTDISYIAAVLIPKADVDAVRHGYYLILGLFLTALLGIGIVIAWFLSKSYVKPITDTLTQLSGGKTGGHKTNFKEIDTLIEKLLALHSGNPIPANLFEDFIRRTKSLTKTELAILWLHIQEKTTEEILAALYIAPDTLKHHNSHIFQKMNVRTKKELVIYGSLINQCGLLSEIFPNIAE